MRFFGSSRRFDLIVVAAAVTFCGLTVDVSAGQLRLPALARLPPSTCRTATMTSETLREFDRARGLALARLGQTTTYVRIVTGGSRMLLRETRGPRVRLRVSMYAKLSGEDRFSPVCRNVEWAPSSPFDVFDASAPRQPSGSVWRIEVVVSSRSAKEPEPALLDILRQQGADRDPDDLAPPMAWNDATGLLCHGLGATAMDKRDTQGFAGLSTLDVDSDPTHAPLTVVQHERLRELILEAVSLWVQGCAACSVAHLSKVRIDEHSYVRESLAGWYASSFADLSTPVSMTDLELGLARALEPTQILQAGPAVDAVDRRKKFSRYVERRVPDDFPLLCELKPPRSTPLLSTTHSLLCLEGDGASGIARIAIRFKNGATYCGEDGDIVACWADRYLTEYNIHNYRFGFGDETPALGFGPIEVELLPVIAHEIGHWIGLGHIDDGESLMASSLDRARCIDDGTIQELVRRRSNDTFQSPLAFRLRRSGIK